MDEQWDFLSLLRNLTYFRRNEETAIQRCFTLLDPLSCTKEFVEQVTRTLSLKSTIPGNASDKNSIYSAKNAIVTEWKEIEISFIENLANLLDQYRLRLEKTSDLKKTNKCLLLANECSSNSQSTNKEIEKEISKLENDIHQHKSSLDVLEASIAPFSCIICQATAQIGIYGFYFQELRDNHVLELDYVHAIFGAKTRVIVDITSQSGLLIEHDDGASTKERNSIFDFHRGYIDMLKCGKMSSQLDCTDLQGSLLRLGQILGKLDQCAVAFEAMNDGREATIAIDFPHICLTFPAKNTVASLLLDLEFFETKIVSVSTIDGSDFKGRKMENLSSVDCCNVKSLSSIFSQ